MSSNYFFKNIQILEGAKSRLKKESVLIKNGVIKAFGEKAIKDAELFAPLAWPMLIEPNDWGEKAGGYLLNEVMKGHEMV